MGSNGVGYWADIGVITGGCIFGHVHPFETLATQNCYSRHSVGISFLIVITLATLPAIFFDAIKLTATRHTALCIGLLFK
jgi:hypothetical protein